MKRRQSIKSALKSATIRDALHGLVGCPAGGWNETEQAWRNLEGELPWREDRSYTASALVSAALTLDHADRYRWREPEEVKS